MKQKRWVAILLCLVLLFSMTGCIGHFYDNVATVDGTEISTGLYLMMQHSAYIEARNLVEDRDVDVFKQKVEGENATDWIRTRTEELMRRYVLVRRLCREKYVELDYESQENLQNIMGYWDLMGDMYIQNGISKDTYQRYYTFTELDQLLFNNMYRTGGELYTDDEELKKEYEEAYAHVRFLSVPLNSTTEGLDVSAQVEGIVKGFEPMLEAGTTLEDLALNELPAIYELLERTYDPQNTAANIGTSYIKLVQTDSQTYSPEFLAHLAEQPLGGTGTYNMGSTMLVYEKIVMFETHEEFESVRDNVLMSLKVDEYDLYLESLYKDYEIEWEFGARWYFRPSTIKRS